MMPDVASASEGGRYTFPDATPMVGDPLMLDPRIIRNRAKLEAIASPPHVPTTPAPRKRTKPAEPKGE